MKSLKQLMIAFVLMILVIASVGCEEKGSAEKAGEKMDKTMESSETMEKMDKTMGSSETMEKMDKTMGSSETMEKMDKTMESSEK